MRSHSVMSPDGRQALSGESPADEPLVQCAAGMAMHDPSFLRGLRALCDEYAVHLIADEIAVGCGRTGSFFAFEQAALLDEAALWPDFVCLSKGISGGYLPLSLMMTRDSIYEAFLDDDVARGFLHSHSYTGNALACRAALAVLDRFEQDDVLRINRQRAVALTQAPSTLWRDSRVEHFRQLGMIWAFEVRQDVAGPRFAERFHLAGREHELLIRPIGRTVYLLPPYLLDDTLSRWLGERVIATLDAVTTAGGPHADPAPEPATA